MLVSGVADGVDGADGAVAQLQPLPVSLSPSSKSNTTLRGSGRTCERERARGSSWAHKKKGTCSNKGSAYQAEWWTRRAAVSRWARSVRQSQAPPRGFHTVLTTVTEGTGSTADQARPPVLAPGVRGLTGSQGASKLIKTSEPLHALDS